MRLTRQAQLWLVERENDLKTEAQADEIRTFLLEARSGKYAFQSTAGYHPCPVERGTVTGQIGKVSASVTPAGRIARQGLCLHPARQARPRRKRNAAPILQTRGGPSDGAPFSARPEGAVPGHEGQTPAHGRKAGSGDRRQPCPRWQEPARMQETSVAHGTRKHVRAAAQGLRVPDGALPDTSLVWRKNPPEGGGSGGWQRCRPPCALGWLGR